MKWVILFLILIILVIGVLTAFISLKIQMHRVIAQLNAVLNEKTKKPVTVSLSDRSMEKLVEIINCIIAKNDIHFVEIQNKENELKENISCLSHDLRTPLTSIRGYLQLLQNAPAEKREAYMTALSEKSLRLEHLIDDFYQISLLDAGQYQIHYEDIEIGSLLTETLLDNYSVFNAKKIEPEIDILAEEIHVFADRMACIRIIQNLIFNAAASTTKKVRICLSFHKSRLLFCVENPIEDISIEEPAKLLERFYVADTSRNKETSGQGLYIVKKLLLRMNCNEPNIEIEHQVFKITIDFSPLLFNNP